MSLLDYLASASNFERPAVVQRVLVFAPAKALDSGEEAVPEGAARSAEADEPLASTT